MKNLSNWLNANKISLNVSKTELIISKPRMKKVDVDLKLKLNGKIIHPTKYVKYLVLKLMRDLCYFAIKLNRDNATYGQ